jgi:catechol 2,3-dioxygenase-like lactoylglutathione lyase family enzyme
MTALACAGTEALRLDELPHTHWRHLDSPCPVTMGRALTMQCSSSRQGGREPIGIRATDPARSVAFYQVLGFSEAYTNDRGVMMADGDMRLFLFATRQPDQPLFMRDVGLFGKPPGMEHISIAVTDVDAIYAKLREARVACDGPPEDESWGARMVGLKDPDGNNLYLLQRL